MIKIEAYGHITADHKLVIENRKRMQEDLNQAKECDVVIIIKKRGKRSSKQNRYLFGVVYFECRLGFANLGHRTDADTIHEFFKGKYLPEYVRDEHGTVIAEFPGSTTELNKEEFSNYIENIRAWAAENLGINIPDSDASLAMDF